MNSEKTFSLLANAARGAVFAVIVALIPSAQAGPPIFWTGPSTSFTQTPPGNTGAGGQDVIVPGFAFTRPSGTKPYNAALEGGSDLSTSPRDSEWATATGATLADLTQATNLNYTNFITWAKAFGTGHLNGVVNHDGVLHLTNENIYIAIKFTFWGGPFGSGFAYTRSTAPLVQPTPTVSITNPASGAIFAAPANVALKASASVSSGTVTNVAFFAALNGVTNPVGSAQSPPFNVTANNLLAGNYSFRAVATAAGVSATSAPVTISVVNAAAVTATTPLVTNGNFTFHYSATPGLSYVVQNSSNLLNWRPVVTNSSVGSSTVNVSDPFVSGANRFYRVGRLPNP